MSRRGARAVPARTPCGASDGGLHAGSFDSMAWLPVLASLEATPLPPRSDILPWCVRVLLLLPAIVPLVYRPGDYPMHILTYPIRPGRAALLLCDWQCMWLRRVATELGAL